MDQPQKNMIKMKLRTICATFAITAQVIQMIWWSTHIPVLHDQDEPPPPPPPPQEHQQRCAINMYGLPRYFKDAVLPSLITNVIETNRHYNCDYYIHFFNVTFEPGGRSGAGGEIHPEEVLLVEPAVMAVQCHKNCSSPATSHRLPMVQFVADFNKDFERERKGHLQAIFRYDPDQNSSNTRNPYFIRKESHSRQTLLNILKMWHSQTKVWDLMENAASRIQHHANAAALGGGNSSYYSRVAMLRLDVIYMTPIDIFKVPNDPSPFNFRNGKADLEQGSAYLTWPVKGPVKNADYYFHDSLNRHAVIPAFASYPVNDRMIYGPHAAVKIWATERWDRYHHHVHKVLPTHGEESFGLHDEMLVAYTVIPAIRTETGIEVMNDRNLYFLRVRANGHIWIGEGPNYRKFAVKAKREEFLAVKAKLEELLKVKCNGPFSVKTAFEAGKWQIYCPPL
jgi:hypothetical protein